MELFSASSQFGPELWYKSFHEHQLEFLGSSKACERVVAHPAEFVVQALDGIGSNFML